MLQLVAPKGQFFVWKPSSGQWLLRPDGGQSAAPLTRTPFVIGRSWDCQLVLPSTPELQQSTSRWHCHIEGGAEGYTVADGSLRETPEAGLRKPSVSGTRLNGRAISGAERLGPGDELGIGPWTFGIQNTRPSAVDIGGQLARIAEERPRAALLDDARRREGFARLGDLFARLGSAQDPEGSLVVLAEYVLEKLPQAQVVAILLDGEDGHPVTRLAWQRGTGRVEDFRFSTQLVRALPPDQTFLLAPRLALRSASQTAQDITSALLVPLLGGKGRLGVLYLDNRGSGRLFEEADLYLASALAAVAAQQLALERQLLLARVEQNMRQYFGPEAVRLIVERSKSGQPVGLEVTERSATIVFVDMQGFSAFCRTRPPRDVSELLSPYFQLVSECIQRHGGHVDKFIGDGVLGVFGASPVDEAGPEGAHALRAVRAARALIREWSGRSRTAWGRAIPLRAGLHSGKVVVGNIGFPGRLEYSVLGDTVNLAARMEKLAEPDALALTDSTRALVQAEFPCRDGGETDVHSFGPVRVWHLR